MPLYYFKNNETQDIEEHMVSMSGMDEFKKNNPHLEQTLSTPNIISGTSFSGGSLPEGFKDTLREMKKKHPHGHGITQV